MSTTKEAVKPATTPTAKNGAPTAEVFKLPLITPERQPKKPLPLEDVFYRLDLLFSLRDKHDKLRETQQKLEKFVISSDGRGNSIKLTDAAGETFHTSNEDVFKKITDWLKEDIAKKLETVGSQITL